MESALPQPLPDNPLKWDGWKQFDSGNPYERLCLDFEEAPNSEQIEKHCRQLLVWWQKKLPLKNQPSNPIAQMLRFGLDSASRCLVEARTELLDAEKRAELDARLRHEKKETASVEFAKFFAFATSNGELGESEEQSLHEMGEGLGLLPAEVGEIIESEMQKHDVKREEKKPEPPSAERSPLATPPDEFRRLLKLSCLDDDEMTDDQRDALCNMGESLGLTGGEAEELIDEYLESASDFPPTASPLAKPKTSPTPVKKNASPAPANPQKPAKKAEVDISEKAQRLAREKNPNYRNSLEMEMRFVVPNGFEMGSDAPLAGADEKPVSRVTISGFYMARFPVTNAQFEQFQRAHRSRRAPWADDQHPVIYVTYHEAQAFCKWLANRENKKYRLPTEAEWEYAARGTNPKKSIFPWGERLDGGDRTNFADCNTTFPWAEVSINDGFAQTSPVGNYPRGASPFGIEDMAGNVWEWCLDAYALYKPQEKTNPKILTASGGKRVYRGGSWKSRSNNLRVSARGSNLPDSFSNDVGFRIICECS